MTMIPTITLVILWTATIGDVPEAGYSSVTVVGDKIYVTGNFAGSSTIFCLNAADGEQLWTYRNGKAWEDMFSGTRSTPLVDGTFAEGGCLYDESPHGEIVCLEATTGKQIWSRNPLTDYETPNTLYGRSASLRIDGDKLFTQLGGERASFLCLDKKTGNTLWLGESTGNAAGYGTPTLFEHEGIPMLAALDAKGLFVVNRQTGKLFFHVRHPARLDENITTPIYHEGHIFITNGAGSNSKMLRLVVQGETVSAEEVWTNDLLANSHQGVVLLNGLLYGTTSRGSRFACIRWNDGSDVFLDRNIVRGSFDLADELFYILTEFGEVVVAKPAATSFEVFARLQLPDADGGQAYAHPVVHGDKMYVRIGPTLYCIQIVVQ